MTFTSKVSGVLLALSRGERGICDDRDHHLQWTGPLGQFRRTRRCGGTGGLKSPKENIGIVKRLHIRYSDDFDLEAAYQDGAKASAYHADVDVGPRNSAENIGVASGERRHACGNQPACKNRRWMANLPEVVVRAGRQMPLMTVLVSAIQW